MEKIDFIITWVDGNDPIWSKEKKQFVQTKDENNEFVAGENRYCDNGLLKYWFRGVEKYAPFVNKIHFVTYGHIPSWLDCSNPRINIVRHKDFIPGKYLPTFNSNTILLNLHRIKNLSNNFVLFNDDMFLINNCKENDFFKNNFPTDMLIQEPIVAPNQNPFWSMMLNNVSVINRNFNKKNCFKTNVFKWINFKYGAKNIIKNCFLLNYKKFVGFYDTHLPYSYNKSTFEEIWQKEFSCLDKTCVNKFRTSIDITEWVMRYWQLAKGNFKAMNKDRFGTYTSLKNPEFALKMLKNRKYKMICLNDENTVDKMTEIIDFLEAKFPTKSKFEI